MGKDLKGKELSVGISQSLADSMLVDLSPNMDNGNRNNSVNCKSADSGWWIHSIRTSIVI